MKDQPSSTQDEPWWTRGLKPKPGGNPPDVPPDYLYNRDGNFYVDPRDPHKWMLSEITPPPVIDRRVLPNGEVEEWVRPRTIPDYFVYDPVRDSYDIPVEPADPETDPLGPEGEFAEDDAEDDGPRGILSYESLRAAGAFDVPPAWRKSLSDKRTRGDGEQRDLFSDLPAEGSPSPKKRRRSKAKKGDNASGDGDS